MNNYTKELLKFINELDKRGLLTKSPEECDYEKVIWEMTSKKTDISTQEKILKACRKYDHTISFDTDIKKIILDSFDMFDLMMQVEGEFNIDFPTDVEQDLLAQKFEKVGDFIIYMEKQINALASLNSKP